MMNVDVAALSNWVSIRENEIKPRYDLDPISLLFMLAIFPFKKLHFKYSFSKDGVFFDPPSSATGTRRRIYDFFWGGAASKDLNHFRFAFRVATQQWEPAKNAEIRRLFEFAVAGYVKLIETTYASNGEVEDAFNYSKLMITNACLIELPKIELPPIGIKTKNIWTIEQIKVCNDQIALAKSKGTGEAEVAYIETVCAKCFDQYNRIMSEVSVDNSNN